MGGTKRGTRIVVLLLIAVAGCGRRDDASDDAPVPLPTSGTSAAGIGGAGGMAGASGSAPMPGMIVMRPELDAGMAASGSGGSGSAGSDAGPLDAGLDATIDAGEMPDGGELDGGTRGDGGFGPNEDECGEIPMGPPVAATSGRVDEYGTIEYDVQPPNELIALRTTMQVPEEPPPGGTIFLWPGIQPLPGSANYTPIRNGVLQPVLTWGPSCVPGAPSDYDSWWISPVYVNVSSNDSDYRGCLGGPVIRVQPETLLDIDMQLAGTDWVQQVQDSNSGESTEFTLDLQGQGQARALFVIELPSYANPTEDLIFTHSVFSMKMSEPSACEVLRHGPNDYASEARVSADGKHCCIDRIVLRAQGVPASTADP